MAVAMFCTVCSITINPVSIEAADFWPEGPEVQSASAIVMEASTGTVLYEKNSTDAHYPASITKIMTTLLALENGNLDDTVTFSSDAVFKTEGSSIARDVGEQMTLEQCLYAVMLNSANECAYAVAEHIGGTVDNFVNMMNEKAVSLGCQNTHFNNPHGLQDENHYTCAADMAKIARAAWQNETFRIITGTQTYTIPPTNVHSEETLLQNHNEMLYAFKTNKYLYDYCVGGKTGYTEAANSTLVTYAQKDGMTLICVVMNVQSPGQWTDTRSLFDYCFDNFQVMNVADNETRLTQGSVDVGDLNVNKDFVEIDASGCVVIPKTASFADTVPTVDSSSASGNVVGTIQYSYADRVVGSVNILTNDAQITPYAFDNAREGSEVATESTESTNGKGGTFRVNFRVIIYVILAIIGAGILILGGIMLFAKISIWRHRMAFQKRNKSPYKTIKPGRRRKRKRR